MNLQKYHITFFEQHFVKIKFLRTDVMLKAEPVPRVCLNLDSQSKFVILFYK